MALTASRRSDGLQPAQKHTQPSPQQQDRRTRPSTARMKRPLVPIDNLSDPPQAKRTRIAVEIFTRPLAQLGPKPILVKRQLATPPVPVPVLVASSQKPDRPPAAALVAPLLLLPTSLPTATTAPPPPSRPRPRPPPAPLATTTRTGTATATTTTATSKELHGLTRNQEKVINGIRHELDRLQPSAADTSSAAGPPGRKLRSQEATRFKSELSAYFPEYDEVIGNDPKEQHLLNADTPIVVVDTAHESLDGAATTTALACQHSLGSNTRLHTSTVRIYSDRLFTDLQYYSPVVHFPVLKTEHNSIELEDPLPDSRYAPAHRRAERLEKSIRNTERGRAQHEKDQIIRLLGELQGPDWLRTMGVNGVTESRRKGFEPARDHFIKGCQTILDKFRLWSQEEKRRKLERERALAEETDEEDDEDQDEGQDEDDDDGVDSSSRGEDSGSLHDVDMVDVENDDGGDPTSEGDPPEYSDVDAAARQLHDEAMERARYAASASPRKPRGELPLLLEPIPREFTSFFEKRHQRDAALNKDRRRGRTILAWGHPVPEMSEYDFELPDYCLDEDTLKARERQKRRERRQRKQ
ncbi:hypothetical protein F4802DRAFT_592782 [Xylaria palmicola]|nr:hypothetical protein F4802DRAFT_592782 [Xylaria palmicola]